MITMTNGTTSSIEELLDRAGLRDCFEASLDVQGPRCWKPGWAAYDYAVGRAGVEARDALLVAVHPWDVDGAVRAGLAVAWLRRGAITYPAHMKRPTFVVEDVGELAARLAGG